MAIRRAGGARASTAAGRKAESAVQAKYKKGSSKIQELTRVRSEMSKSLSKKKTKDS